MPRPRVALVLSGGGARGFAHVGVLRALHDMRVPIDMVVGTSMGAVVGGAFASGRSVDELEAFVRSTDWSEVVADRAPRDRLDYRRREDDLLVPSRIEFGVGPQGVRLPPSTVGNQALEAALVRLLPADGSERPLNLLGVPFRAMASDLLSGEAVELVDTPLFASLRASLAMPGVFSPIRIKGRLLVDGGLVRNLPVDSARAMGADMVIAVNVGTPLSGEDELGSALGVAQQMLHILTEQNVQRSLKELRPPDILISPELSGVRFLDFSQSEAAMAAGERAARALEPRLQALVLAPAAYAAHDGARLAAPGLPAAPGRLARLEVQATEHAGSAALQAYSGLRVGDEVGVHDVHEAASRLMGRGDFERVEVEVLDGADGRIVRLAPVEAPWARSRLRVGLDLSSDFGGESRFAVNGLHVLSWLNSWGAELRTLARIGSERLLLTQLRQPIAPGSPWVVMPALSYRASTLDVFVEGERSQRFDFETTSLAFAAGRQLANVGQVMVGVERRLGRARQLFATNGAMTSRLRETARFVDVQFDTLDSLALPSRGVLLQMRLERANLGPDAESRSSTSIQSLAAFGRGTWSGHVWAEWARSRSGLAPLQLGGFLRLSGTPRESISDRAVVLTRLVMARRIGAMPAGLGGALRAGYSLELGAGYDPDRSIGAADLERAGSAFVSVDTRFGPMFLAWGATRGRSGTLYLFLGPFW